MKRFYSIYNGVMDKLVESLRLHDEDLKVIDLKYYKRQKRKEQLIDKLLGRDILRRIQILRDSI